MHATFDKSFAKFYSKRFGVNIDFRAGGVETERPDFQMVAKLCVRRHY